ncbi:MAG: ankyrin repeat domain-containing protein [Methylophaga sp.]|nr:ankyrin repeat domain-containing protein [Methylophaga sp.]
MTEIPAKKPESTEQLFDLARNGDTDSLRSHLQKGVTPDLTDSNGNSFLILVSALGDLQTCQLLLEFGANVNAASPEGKNPLMFAAMFNQAEIVDLLLANGADAYAKSADGLTALALARAMGAEAATRRLAQHVELF